MVHVLILIVLVIIAILLAPWLLGVLAAMAVAYGVYVVGFAVLMAVAALVGVVWALFGGGRRQVQEAPPIAGERVACRQCQAEVSAQLSYCDNCGAKL